MYPIALQKAREPLTRVMPGEWPEDPFGVIHVPLRQQRRPKRPPCESRSCPTDLSGTSVASLPALPSAASLISSSFQLFLSFYQPFFPSGSWPEPFSPLSCCPRLCSWCSSWLTYG